MTQLQTLWSNHNSQVTQLNAYGRIIIIKWLSSKFMVETQYNQITQLEAMTEWLHKHMTQLKFYDQIIMVKWLSSKPMIKSRNSQMTRLKVYDRIA